MLWQIGTFVESIVGTSASASLFLPAVLFVVAVFLAFSTGTSWGTFAILVPIAIAMFPGADHLEMMIIAVSAVLAGTLPEFPARSGLSPADHFCRNPSRGRNTVR